MTRTSVLAEVPEAHHGAFVEELPLSFDENTIGTIE
jgi:hypothetical protein